MVTWLPAGPGGQQPNEHRRIITRSLLPLLINSALCEYAQSPELTNRYLKELEDLIYKNGLDLRPRRERFIQLLLRGSDDPELDRPDRPWFVGRMLKVMKRLSLASWERIMGLLMRALVLELNPSAEPLDMWVETIRAEALAAPSEAFVSPLLLDTPT